MPKENDVVPGELIESLWGNQAIRDKTVQRANNDADLTSGWPAPQPGECVYQTDIDELKLWDGSAWVTVGDGQYLPLTGGTMTGDLNMNGHTINGLADPTGDTGAVPLKFLTDNFLPLTGGLLTGDLNMNGHAINGLADPTGDSGAVSLGYLKAAGYMRNTGATIVTYDNQGGSETSQLHNIRTMETGPPSDSTGINGDLVVSLGNNANRGLWVRRSSVWQHMANLT